MNRYIIFAFLMGLLSSFLGGSLGMIAASPLTQERTEYVFVYGTLTNPVTRAYACWCWTELEPARLPGYAKTIRNIVPVRSGVVRGGLIKVSSEELARLDAYEDVPRDYERRRIRVGDRMVWVYFKTTDEKLR